MLDKKKMRVVFYEDDEKQERFRTYVDAAIEEEALAIANEIAERLEVDVDSAPYTITEIDTEMSKDKKYQVVFVDEYDNWYEIGWFNDLRDAEPFLNDQMESYVLSEDDEMMPGAAPRFGDTVNDNLGILEEYAGTYGPVFDRNIVVEEGCLQVRGFVR